MWQRIQTVYLSLAVLANILLMSGLPIMTATDSKVVYAKDDMLFFILILISTIDAFLSIFLFKKRKLQVFIGRIAILTAMIAVVKMLYTFLTVQKTLAHVSNIGMWMPLVFIVLVALANKAILRDEEKVRSADRIR
ncbi:MAG: DUF4293 domain-containing protein [Thermaurantimonas sp.]|uniref:Membrane protein n=1 Tax=Thermaurantimonas aggregans TaxID=2173829 RepID=A0A401XJL2_9FLAO|nr:DUF4293 domain-containing protein [Thermaurantimonas aggregans]MCX8148699.1 DUF4293 domain-containing protein [Thermaurantimonas aggregans]GCD77164.1 membrane protein [Thermaurantimonas aggregans]